MCLRRCAVVSMQVRFLTIISWLYFHYAGITSRLWISSLIIAKSWMFLLSSSVLSVDVPQVQCTTAFLCSTANLSGKEQKQWRAKAFLQNKSWRKIFLLLLKHLVKKGPHLEVSKQLWSYFQGPHCIKKILSPKYQNTNSTLLTQLNITILNPYSFHILGPVTYW